MDVLEPKQRGELADEVKFLLKILKFGSKSVELKGSSSLKSQRYFSDYDFFVSIKKPTAKVAYKNLFSILKNIWGDERLYFIELKLQTKDGKKVRYYPEDKPEFTVDELAEVWPDIDFVKIDLVAYFDYRFIDVSVIYSFTDKKPTREEYIDGLKADIKELKKEGRYYKVLKRLFNIYKVEGEKDKLLMLSNFFNSDAGLFYRKISNNEAINTVLEHYLDDTTAKRVEINRRQLGDVGADDEARINREAKKLYSSINGVVGGGRTHRENVLKEWGLEDKSYSLKELSGITAVPIDILQEVYNRGWSAYTTQPESVRLKGSFVKNVDAPLRKKLSQGQWAMARVYSFLDGNKKHDDDLRPNISGGARKPLMLELFKGTGSVGKVAKKMGFDVFSLDIDPKAKPDLVANILDVDVSKLPVPDYVWASPPCNTFSPLVYKLKERNPETAEPYSDRAKEGTEILYKTLSIINALLKKNPKLYYCIENPQGMMRKDKKMMALPYMTTTLYCLYGDGKQKRTDFWSNYPLTLKEGNCGAKTPVQNSGLTLNEKYRMPPSLIRDILKQIPDRKVTRI